MERTWGPVNGFYLTAYAAPTADGERYASYAKVCWSRPRSYWEADCAFKIFGGEHYRTPEAALAAVAVDARNEVSLVPLRARPRLARRRRDPSVLPRLFSSLFAPQRMA